MKPWLVLSLALVALCSIPQTQSFSIDDDNDSLFTLVLLQMITNNNDPEAMQSLYPLLLTSVLGDKSGSSDISNSMYYLLLGAGDDENMQQWLPLILNNNKKTTSDKLLMLIFMQRNRVTSGTGMNNMFPLLLLNANDNKYCDNSGTTCTCKEDNSEMLLYTMLLGGNNGGTNNYSNFMYLLFDDDNCAGTTSAGASCTCTSDLKGGIDAVTMMMLMQMNPQVSNSIPQTSIPQRAIDVKSILKQQLFTHLGPEYSWMQQFQETGTTNSALMKFQLASQMGIPPDVLTLLTNGGTQSDSERFALIQWMSQGSNLSIETMSLMLGIEDAKQFYIQSMIENGSVDPLTASLMLASQGSVSKDKMKELLIMAATNPNINPDTFATIARPYVPVLPRGIYPGQDLYFIHIELLKLNTCAFVEPSQRKACASNMGSFVTAEQCEVKPYCCYNPYIGETEVPWCYYNIFFVFHDQYRLRVKEADQFKGPQDCPGLFRYGIDLDPFMYKEARDALQATANKVTTGGFDTYNNAIGSVGKIAKLIHLRRDVGFPGITEFHCTAIKGACWDRDAARYPGQYKIPQCYEEESIGENDDYLNLYDPELFKPVVPTQFRAAEGECDSNYFHISTLYYERRACTYNIDMIKYGNEFNPLTPPSRDDCLYRLGCCWEEDETILAKYQFMPRCYRRIANELQEDRLFQMEMVKEIVPATGKLTKMCGAEVGDFLTRLYDDEPKTESFNGGLISKIEKSIRDWTGRDIILQFKKLAGNDLDVVDRITETPDDICLFRRKFHNRSVRSCKKADASLDDCEFWKFFDLFNRHKVRFESEKFDGIPLTLKDMVDDIF